MSGAFCTSTNLLRRFPCDTNVSMCTCWTEMALSAKAIDSRSTAVRHDDRMA